MEEQKQKQIERLVKGILKLEGMLDESRKLIDSSNTITSSLLNVITTKNGQIENLEAQLRMKQDDWIGACKEVDGLKAQLCEAKEGGKNE
jgi:peptidoglycan hydrolase CwlO-like protein